MVLHFIAGVLLALIVTAKALASVHHNLDVELDPAHAGIRVSDTLILPPELATGKKPVEFLLHQSFEVESNVTIEKLSQQDIPPHLTRYRISKIPASGVVALKYSGVIDHPLEKPVEESARSFGSTLGIISQKGVFLDGNSGWYPDVDNDLVSFTLNVKTPQPWVAVSAGQRIKQAQADKMQQVTWQESAPQDDIYLIAAPFKAYSQQAGNVEIQVYLRQDDPQLAQQYLDTGARYMEMYQKLLGKYPYQKFAAVENFWETGFGMPSFTLLGPRVMRFPFVLNGSYPHEILHNWWGNGVFVDYASGNWAEGLTAYLADHLIAEQRGGGTLQRRDTLQKYADYVNQGRDFALRDFHARHDSASEAVGYGKAMMLFHMLRLRLGDESFTKALRQLYRDYKFKKTGYSDVAKVFSEVAKQDLAGFFSQWVDRVGAPSLRLSKVELVANEDGRKELLIEIEQVQQALTYQLNVPVVAEFANGHIEQLNLALNERSASVRVNAPAAPVRVLVDPSFDVFRRLDAREVPAALSQGFGAPKALAVLPAAETEKIRNAYRQMIEIWRATQQNEIEVVLDSDLADLPDDKPVWLFGWRNRFRDTVSEQISANASSLSADTLTIANNQYYRNKHSVVVSARHPRNPGQTLLWVASDNTAALAGLARKLPHYRKYSYLAFSGKAPENIGKGQWQVNKSPLVKTLTYDIMPTYEPPARSALAQPLALFSEQRMLNDIRYLASPELGGRGLGTVEIDRAAAYIAKEYENAGLQAIGDSYLQSWQTDIKDLGKVRLINVVGVIAGSNPAYAGQSVILAAHYDHLGKGWPDVREGNEGKLHPGADDNASGIAVMLEIARTLGKSWQPERSVVFVAFSGEEAGLLGSRHYSQSENEYPANKAIGVINLDTVGRLGDNPVNVFDTYSASEWEPIFRGVGHVTGVKINTNERAFGASDHRSFHDIGVPGVQIFSGVHLDYHRPSDTVDKIDSAGLVKVASVVHETLQYLAKRPESLTAQLGNGAIPNGGSPTSGGRKVSIGTVPDFDYRGNGVRVSDILRDSPAAVAGLKKGDILTSINTATIRDLSDYAAILRQAAAGDQLVIGYLRDGKSAELTVTARPR